MGNFNAVHPAKRFHFEWLFSYLLHPGKMAEQIAQKQATWLTPLLVVSLLIIVRIWFSAQSAPVTPSEMIPAPIQGPAGMTDTQLISDKTGGGGPPPGGVVISPGPDGNPVTETPVSTANPIVTGLTQIAGLWIGWFLLSIILFVGMVISGSHNNFTETLNLVGWSCLPLGIRQIPLLITSLAIPSISANAAGISALATGLTGPTGFFLTALLKLVDLFFFWQVAMLLMGLKRISPLSTRRVIGVTFSAVIIFLVLASMPAFLTEIFAQLTQPVPGTY